MLISKNNGRAPSTVGLILIQVLVHPLLQGIELQVQGAGFAEQHGVVIGGLHGKTVDLNHEAFTLPEKVRLDSGWFWIGGKKGFKPTGTQWNSAQETPGKCQRTPVLGMETSTNGKAVHQTTD